MRIKNMYFIAKQSFEDLKKYKLEQIKRNADTTVYRGAWTEYKDALKPLMSMEAVKTPLMDYMVFCEQRITSNGYLEISNNAELIKYNALLENLYTSLSTIIALGDSIGYKEIENGFDVKIPMDLQLENYPRFFKDINTIFTQYPYLFKDEAQVKFDRIDIGTTWLIFAVIGSVAIAAMHAVASLIDKAVILKSHFVSMKMQEQQLEAMEDAEELRKDIIKIHEVLKEKYLADAVLDIENKHGELEPEDRIKATNSLKSLTELMMMGTQIYASIESPVEVQALFPPIETQSLDTGIKGLLEQKKE